MANEREEAARWFAASRRGVMLHEERAEYERWRRVPDNASRLAELQAIWQGLGSTGEIVAPDHQLPAAHRRQFVAMVAFVSVTAVAITHFDNVWWNSLDWWSR
jgi:ferric-dicitrate binding protein FerR (iron transport regulator)